MVRHFGGLRSRSVRTWMICSPVRAAIRAHPSGSVVLGRSSFSRCQGPDGFEADVACPVGAKVIHVPEPLATVELQVAQQDAACLYTTAAVLLDVETVQMLITPGEQDLQDGVEMRQRGLAAHKDTTPDEWADAAQDDAQLVETERCSRGHHVLRVTQCRISLKDSPRYLALLWELGLTLRSSLSV
jgi:hypothetical protein